MRLFRVLYVSDAVGEAKAGLLPLIDILGVASRNNRRDHLTGVLMRHDGRFFQVLEGERHDIDRLMVKLRQDRRHQNIRILADRQVDERLMPDWPMAQAEVLAQHESAMARLASAEHLDSALAVEIETIMAATYRAMPVTS